MSILISNSILDTIDMEIAQCTDSFVVISAFCKRALVEHFDEKLSKTVRDKKLIVRMRPEDINSGATDLDLYDYCKKKGWDMYFRLDLHAKTYIFDHLRCVVGSANATSSGLSVGGMGNYEMAIANPVDDEDLLALKRLIKSAVLMTDEIYSIMENTIKVNPSSAGNTVEWPDEIKVLQKNDYAILFSEDFPTSTNPFDIQSGELGFLGIFSDASTSNIRHLFERSRCYLWLLNTLEQKDSHELYFGEASAILHNVLLNDPKPYRKEVKELLQNLLSWIELLGCENIVIDRPNYSQRIRLVM